MANCRLPGDETPLYKSHPYIYGTLLAAGMLLFVSSAVSLVSHTFLFQFDQPVLNYFKSMSERAPKWVYNAINIFSNGTSVLPTLIAFILGSYYLVKKCDKRLYVLLVGFWVGLLWFWILAFAFNRERPALPGWLADVPFPSFPSGHIINWTTLTVTLLYMFASRVKSPTRRWLLIGLGVVYLLFQAFTRLFLQAHYLTDILAGFGVGLTWIGLTIAGVESYDWDKFEQRVTRQLRPKTAR